MVNTVATAVAALALVAPALAGDIQLADLSLPANASAVQAEIVSMFNDSFSAYIQYAFGHDNLAPLSETFIDDLGGYGATAVDALDALILFGGFDDYIEKVLDFIETINFNVMHTSDTVSVFETTIRFVGGFMSSYELSNFQYPILVQKAQEVTDILAYAWSGNNKIPYGQMNMTTKTPTPNTANIAEAGTLTLEYNRLSHYSGNYTYENLANGSVVSIASQPDPLPGLAPQDIDPVTNEFVTDYISWGGGSDSYFEYLIKYARLTNTDNQIYANTWATAVDSSIKHLKSTSTVGNWTYLGDYSGQLLHIGSHLACYMAGNWIMGGKLLNNDTIFQIGLDLNEGCWNTYASTATGIGPETFAWVGADSGGDYTGGASPSSADLEFYNEHGFYIYNGGSDYIQRPEVLESNFYAWRATGDTKYLDRAQSAINSFQKYLKVSVAYSGLYDVDNTSDGRVDETESFWFAEVLKYLWLTFDDPSHISLNDYVFNTECHPYKAPAALSVYGNSDVVPAQQTTKIVPSVTAALPPISANPLLPTPIRSIIPGGQ